MALDLADRIWETSMKLMIERAEGKTQIPKNSFTRSELTFDYSKIDQKYHVSLNPDECIIIYKGALKGFHKTGFLSMALNHGLTEHVMEIKEIIESEQDLICALFDQHTSYYSHTALLSATLNPEQAQVFAPTQRFMQEKEKTIYQVKIKANRCVVDCHDTGHCGSSREILILGAIFSDEISAVKTVNDDQHSELLSSCGLYIRRDPDKKSLNREVKDISNWTLLR